MMLLRMRRDNPALLKSVQDAQQGWRGDSREAIPSCSDEIGCSCRRRAFASEVREVRERLWIQTN